MPSLLNQVRDLVRELNSYPPDGNLGSAEERAADLANAISETGSSPNRILDWFDHMTGGRTDFLTLCDDTLEVVTASDSVRTHDGRTISNSTYERNYFCCDDCGDYFRNSDAHSDEHGEGNYCQSCVPPPEDDDEDEDLDEEEDLTREERARRDRLRGTGHILPYSTDVLQMRNGFRHLETERLPLNPMWLGVELEVENKGTEPTYVSITNEAVKDFAILKADASLPSGGFEIVTVPATLEYHRIAWLPFFETAAKNLMSWSSGKCGMHVHIAKASLSDLTIGRLLVFVNATDNLSFIERLAGRGSVVYSQLSPKKVSDVKTGESRHGHGLAFSNRNQGKTIELRIFRGNVSAVGFFKNLEATHALCEFCKVASIRQLTTAAFLQWLALPANLRAYPYLTRWLAKTKLYAGFSDREMPNKQTYSNL